MRVEQARAGFLHVLRRHARKERVDVVRATEVLTASIRVAEVVEPPSVALPIDLIQAP